MKSTNAGRIICAVLLVFISTPVFGVAVAQSSDPINRDLTISHLNAIISWYRHSTSKVQSGGLPSDVVYQETAKNLAQEAVRLAFQSAKASTLLVDSAGEPTAAASNADNNAQPNFTQMLANVKARIETEQVKLDATTAQVNLAAGSKKRLLTTQKNQLQAEVDLDKATEDAIQKMSAFVESSNDTGATGFAGTVSELARSVPEITSDPNPQKTAGNPAVKTVAPATPQPVATKASGLFSDAAELYTELQAIKELAELKKQTATVRAIAVTLRQPLREAIKAALTNGRAVASEAAPTAPTQAAALEKNLQAITGQFRETANAALPLSQEILVLDQSRANLQNWSDSIVQESKATFRTMLLSVLTLLLTLGILWGLSELWRRWTFRYVHDLRRRRQFLLLRRFVLGFLIGLVLVLGVVSDFTSIATFAGFATAGIVVGLQAVLLSVAAYFFVIGRYGIRVGDRVSVAGVTGDVIDVGLVRFYLMELAGTDINLTPTGRIVVFSNAVLFQATTPLFKQIPGTDYTWHEVAVQFVPGADYQAVQEKLEPVVKAVYEKYREDFERQHRDIEVRLESQTEVPTLQTRLQLADGGIELLLRYPAELRKAGEMDNEVTRALLLAIKNDADVKQAIAGSPKIRTAVRV